MVTLSATNCKNFFYRRDSLVLKPRATRAGDKLIPMKDGLIPSIRLLAAAHNALSWPDRRVIPPITLHRRWPCLDSFATFQAARVVYEIFNTYWLVRQNAGFWKMKRIFFHPAFVTSLRSHDSHRSSDRLDLCVYRVRPVRLNPDPLHAHICPSLTNRLALQLSPPSSLLVFAHL